MLNAFRTFGEFKTVVVCSQRWNAAQCGPVRTQMSTRRLRSTRETIAESESASKKMKILPEELSSSCHDEFDTNSSEKRGDINVALIGGGMSTIYAAVLLKQSTLIKKVNIADSKDTLGGAVFDASHIDTSTRIKYYGKNSIDQALRNVDIVALMDEADYDTGNLDPLDQFISSSCYVHRMAKTILKHCPKSIVAVFARPVTATLPLVSEIYRSCGKWDPNKIVGSTAIDNMRIESMTAGLFDLNPAFLSVPIVGGADPSTVVPLFSKSKTLDQFSLMHEDTLIRQLQSADEDLSRSANRFGGPSLSHGTAASKFIVALASALSGHPNVICSAYVRSNVLPVCRYFANEIQFGRHGIEKNFGLPKVSPTTVTLIERAIPRINELACMAIKIVQNDNSADKIKCY